MSAPLRVLVVGATSAIAQEAARLWAGKGAALLLAGRNEARLSAVADDLKVRGAALCETATLDLTDVGLLPGLLEGAEKALGGIDVLLVAHGLLPDQSACEGSVDETLRAIDVNYTSVVALLTLAVPHLERTKGTIAVLSSVAGDRGRRSNYVYGSAKAGLSAFLSGLRARLVEAGVAVVTVKPGFVDTPMTAALPKSPLFASARAVGAGIVRAVEVRKDVVYLPGWWAPIMFAVRHLPEGIFKKLKF
jgi:short-subunit dehydrogenase